MRITIWLFDQLFPQFKADRIYNRALLRDYELSSANREAMSYRLGYSHQ